MMRCERCGHGDRRPERRARLAERANQTAVVVEVPVEVCMSCGQVWLSMDVAKRLDALFDRLLDSGAESSQIHWENSRAT